MKQYWKVLLIVLVLCVLLPWIATGIGGTMIRAEENPVTTVAPEPPLTQVPTPPAQTETEDTMMPPETTTAPPPMVTICVVNKQGDTVMMELEEYLLGVVLAEMPAHFEMEALKAQAVAARTFTLRCVVMKTKHDGAVCLRSSCCQGYLSETDYYARGGTEKDVQKIRAALEQTWGEVLMYNGKLIQAAYFSCSGGSTEDAADVWGGDVPYLQAVVSPGEEGASVFQKTVKLTAEEFLEELGRTLAGTPDSWFGAVTYTEGGGVDTIVVGGVTYTGKKIRSLLSLNSTKFTITADSTSVTVTTSGYGHRVGMSQYGADAMAVLGSTYDQILAHYFQGTELTKWDY